LALVCLVWDGWLAYSQPLPPLRLFALDAALAVGIVVPLAYAFWWSGAVGGADAKAFMVLALLFPSYPTYYLPGVALPLEAGTLRVFPLTVITNTVLVGALYPLALGVRNLLAGRPSKLAFLGLPVGVERTASIPGRLLETPAGFTRNGLDLDALRMYLRWRGLTLEDLRANAAELRDPDSLPDDANPPTDGAVRTDGGRAAEGAKHPPDPALAEYNDPWGAAAFLESLDGDAYGTTPETLREGLDLLAERERVWVSPGMPFIVPLVVGLLVALTYGDVLAATLGALGLA
jgi:preflagellin peptidase FlaK